MDLENLPEMKLGIKRAVTNGQVCEVLEYDEYIEEFNRCFMNPDIPRERTDLAVLVDNGDQNLLLPLRFEFNPSPISPGIYRACASPISFQKLPSAEAMHKYIPEKIVSIDNLDDIQDIIKAGEEIKRLDEPFITTPDEITKIPIRLNDQQEMVALKTAINEKNVDIDKYANRFGNNFPNDKRQLKNNSVTLNIIKRFADNMDMEVLLTLRDRDPNVPNPIGKEITVSLTNIEEGE